jgi:hypothetical protein
MRLEREQEKIMNKRILVIGTPTTTITDWLKLTKHN